MLKFSGIVPELAVEMNKMGINDLLEQNKKKSNDVAFITSGESGRVQNGGGA